MTFNPIFPASIVVSISIGLCILFLWFEWKKSSRFLFLRCIALIVLIGSLTAFILKPSYQRERNAKDIILLTPGYSEAQADSITKVHPAAIIKRTDGTTPYKNAEWLSDRQIESDLQSVHFVLGNGIPSMYFDRSAEFNFLFLPAKEPTGITDIFFDQAPVANHEVSLRGVINGFKNVKVLLQSPGRMEDSVKIQGDNSFNLRFTPKQHGNFMYRVVLKDSSGNILTTEPLPVQVLPEKTLRILILQDFPTAEVRYLKNFLSDRNHQITLRYQLSRNVFRYEYANTAQRKIERLSTQLLNDFDLMIIDSDALQKFSAMERRQLLESIRHGLGTVVLFNDSPSKYKTLKEVINISFSPTKSDTAYAELTERKPILLKTLGETINSQSELRPVVKANDGKIYSGFIARGAGHVGIQLTTETYRFLAEGKPDLYSAVWSDLLEGTSRVQKRSNRIRILSPDPIYTNEPVDVEITSAFNVPELTEGKITIPLTEDVLIDNRWLGKIWFKETGWQTLTIKQDSTTASLYVHERDNWKSLRISKQQRENQIRQNPLESRGSEMHLVYQEPVPHWIFFAAFLVAAGFLWLAPKI